MSSMKIHLFQQLQNYTNFEYHRLICAKQLDKYCDYDGYDQDLFGISRLKILFTQRV